MSRGQAKNTLVYCYTVHTCTEYIQVNECVSQLVLISGMLNIDIKELLSLFNQGNYITALRSGLNDYLKRP